MLAPSRDFSVLIRQLSSAVCLFPMLRGCGEIVIITSESDGHSYTIASRKETIREERSCKQRVEEGYCYDKEALISIKGDE